MPERKNVCVCVCMCVCVCVCVREREGERELMARCIRPGLFNFLRNSCSKLIYGQSTN